MFKNLLKIIIILYSFFFLAVSAWLFLLKMPLTSLLAILFAAATLPLLLLRSHLVRGAYFTLALIPLFVLTTVLAWNVPFNEFGDRVIELDNKIRKSGSSSFTLQDKVAIYGLNIVMAGGGYIVGFPEVATETLLLTIPGKQTIEMHSDFAMRSPKVKRAILSMSRSLDSVPESVNHVNLGTKKIYWASDKDIWEDSVRVGLATNPLTLKVSAERGGNDDWTLNCTGIVSVKYPRGGRVVLVPNIRGKDLVMSEGLFWALQQEGWLFPYKMHWKWSVDLDDKRLQEKNKVNASVMESLLLALWDISGKGSFF